MKIDFLRIFYVFSKYVIPKGLLECIDYISSYLPKLNSGLELVSGAHI